MASPGGAAGSSGTGLDPDAASRSPVTSRAVSPVSSESELGRGPPYLKTLPEVELPAGCLSCVTDPGKWVCLLPPVRWVRCLPSPRCPRAVFTGLPPALVTSISKWF